MNAGHHGLMTTARRILIPGALIAIPVVFAVGSVAMAQMPPSPELPDKPLIVQLTTPTPTPTPTPTTTPTVEPSAPVVPVPPPAVPVPQPRDDDGDDDGGDDD